MGSGKSTIGKQLAAALGLSFHDSDHEIQRRTGVDIPTIFAFEGEAGFRAREKAVIDALTAMDGQVLATGGGAILDPANRRALSVARRGGLPALLARAAVPADEPRSQPAPCCRRRTRCRNSGS